MINICQRHALALGDLQAWFLGRIGQDMSGLLGRSGKIRKVEMCIRFVDTGQFSRIFKVRRCI